MRQLGRTRFGEIAYFLLGLVLTQWIGVSPSAFAARPAVDCLNPNTLRSNIEAYQSTAKWNGVKVDGAPGGMKVSDTDVVCQRVSSIGVIHGPADNLEVGWFESPDDHTCYPSGATDPRRLIVWVFADAYMCSSSQASHSVPSGGYVPFAVQDGNGDGTWSYYVSGSNVFARTTGWNPDTGWSVTNAERTSTSDSAYSDFEYMQYMEGSGYLLWSSAKVYCDTDPDYGSHFVTDSYIVVQVQGTGQNCPAPP